MKTSSKKIAYLGLFTALAMVLSYLELLIPPIYPAVPGIKIGLPNIIIIYVLYKNGLPSAALVSVTRVFVTALLFGNAMTLAYSLAGAVLSIIIMYALKKSDRFSTVGVSVCGGIFHNLGQILMAILLLQSAVIGYYMIILAITGTVSGVVIGIIGSKIIKRF